MKISNARRLQLLDYASHVMGSRPPDLTINGGTHRWMVYPKNKWRNIYIHHWVRGDIDQVLHDHEPDNLSVILSGCCDELFHAKPLRRDGEGFVTRTVRRTEGDVVFRLAGTPHKILLPGGDMVSMFIQGPRRRKWGFHCPSGWRPWQEYIDSTKGYGDRSGKGCG